MITVLVVDDEPVVRLVAARLLERRGYGVVQAADALQALQQLEDAASPIDLVLTDVRMPYVSGVELAAMIRERWPRVPVLFMSGQDDGGLAASGAPEGAVPFLEKPFDEARLFAQLATILGTGVVATSVRVPGAIDMAPGA